MKRAWSYPFQDPFANPLKEEVVKVLWDYEAQKVVDVGDVSCGLFDTHWTYSYTAGSRLAWAISRCPGEHIYLQEADVPEMVRLAVMVIE